MSSSCHHHSTAPAAPAAAASLPVAAFHAPPHPIGSHVQNDPWKDRHRSPAELFDRYLNTCHHQGSRTIRTEEALLITLAFLQPALHTVPILQR